MLEYKLNSCANGKTGGKVELMFKKFVQELVNAKTKEEVENIFYRSDGIDIMYQKEKLSWKDQQLLLDLVNKLLELMD